jgi:hypothetical protein
MNLSNSIPPSINYVVDKENNKLELAHSVPPLGDKRPRPPRRKGSDVTKMKKPFSERTLPSMKPSSSHQALRFSRFKSENSLSDSPRLVKRQDSLHSRQDTNSSLHSNSISASIGCCSVSSLDDSATSWYHDDSDDEDDYLHGDTDDDEEEDVMKKELALPLRPISRRGEEIVAKKMPPRPTWGRRWEDSFGGAASQRKLRNE